MALICLIAGVVWFAQNSAQSQGLNLSLSPQSKENNFVLSWSADSYVPADYEGKALPTRGSEIRVVAEPTKKISQDPEKLTYRWLLDNDIAGYASGQGKSVFRFRATKWAGDTHEIESQVLDEKETLISRNVISVKIAEPELLIKQATGNYALKESLSAFTGQDVKILAIPLFFHIKNLGEVAWQWRFDNQTLSSPDQKDLNQLTLKIPKGNLSNLLKKDLSVSAANKKDDYQQGAVNLTIEIR